MRLLADKRLVDVVKIIPPLRESTPVVVDPPTVNEPLNDVVPAFKVRLNKAVKLDGKVADAPITKLEAVPPTNVPFVVVNPPFNVSVFAPIVKAVEAAPLIVHIPPTITFPESVFASEPDNVRLLYVNPVIP